MLRIVSLRKFVLGFVALAAFGPAARAESIVALRGRFLNVFNSNKPQNLGKDTEISGLQPGERVVGIDFRGVQLYALGTSNRLYTVDFGTGIATPVAALSAPLVGTSFGMAYDPASDRLLVTSDAGQVLSIDPQNGVVTVGGGLAYAADDVNAGSAPSVPGLAAWGDHLYGIDTNQDVLASYDWMTGTLNTIGPLERDIRAQFAGFDVSERTGLAYAILSPAPPISEFSLFYTVNLQTGALKFESVFGPPEGVIATGMAVVLAAIPEPATMLLLVTGLAGVGATLRKKRHKA